MNANLVLVNGLLVILIVATAMWPVMFYSILRDMATQLKRSADSQINNSKE